jgi:hypothetical protein
MGAHYGSLLLLVLVAGCAQGPIRSGSAQGHGLQAWVAGELAPYLAVQLSEHPRFKGQPVILVRLEGQDVQSEIDGLTRSIRDQIRDALLAAPGVRLPWQPQQILQRHHRRLEGARCGRVRDAAYFVGIEIARAVDGRFRASVRALDVGAREWVSGFGKHWEGFLTTAERRALAERRPDESLRGLRVLPFGPGQSDLAAAYLANNLSCLLRQQDGDDRVLYVEPLPSTRPGLRSLLSLVGNNLSRYREVRVSDVRKEANLVLRGEVHEIQPGLYQLWVVLHPLRSGVRLAGMDTDAYVRVPTHSAVRSTRLRRSDDPRPVIARLGLVRSSEAGEDCRAWDGACGRVEMTVDEADRVFVFALARGAGLLRLAPGGCRLSTGPVRRGRVHHAYVLPEAGLEPGTVYALAVRGRDLGRRLSHLMARLPDACSEQPGPRLSGPGLERWLVELDGLMEREPARVAWRAKRLP